MTEILIDETLAASREEASLAELTSTADDGPEVAALPASIESLGFLFNPLDSRDWLLHCASPKIRANSHVYPTVGQAGPSGNMILGTAQFVILAQEVTAGRASLRVRVQTPALVRALIHLLVVNQ